MRKFITHVKEKSVLYSFTFMVLILLLTYFQILTGKLWLKWDVYDAAFPLSVAISDALIKGELPLWEPFSFRGVPLSHLIGVSVWSPLTIILGLFGFTQYLMQIQYLILILLAAIFMYISIYHSFKNPWIAMVAGVAYATCGQFVSNAEHLTFLFPMVVFPLLHFAYKRWVKEYKYRWSILIGVCFGMLILNNYPPFLFISAVFILFEYLFEIRVFFKSDNKRTVLFEHTKHLLVALTISCLTGFVSITTTLEIISQITRGELSWELATDSSLNHWYWFGLITPMLTQVIHSSRLDIDLSMNNVYIALPIILLALARVPKRKKEIAMVVIILIAVLTVMGKYGFIYRVFYETIPSIDSFKFPAGFRFIFFYYVTFYASYNLHKFVEGNNPEFLKRLRTLIKWVAIMVSFTLGSLVIISVFKINTVNIPRYSVMELIGSLLVLLILFNFLSTNRRTNLLLFCSSIIIFSFLGVLRNAEFTIGTPVRPLSFQQEVNSKYNTDALNIKNIFTEPDVNVLGYGIFKSEFQTGGYIGSFELNKFKEAYEAGKEPEPGDPLLFAVNEGSVSTKTDGILTVNSGGALVPELIKYSPNKFSVEIELDKPSYVILEQSIFKGWTAYVNNRQTPIYEIDGGVMGIKVDSGVNIIVFEFKPRLTIIAAWVTFLTWILLAIFGSVLFIKKRSRKEGGIREYYGKKK